jgi:hypothetical protein
MDRTYLESMEWISMPMYKFFTRPFRLMGKNMMQILSIYFVLHFVMPYLNREIIL